MRRNVYALTTLAVVLSITAAVWAQDAPGGTGTAGGAAVAAPAGAPLVSQARVADDIRWRYRWHDGRWWFWMPDNRWVVWNGAQWTPFTPGTVLPDVRFYSGTRTAFYPSYSSPGYSYRSYPGYTYGDPYSGYYYARPYRYSTGYGAWNQPGSGWYGGWGWNRGVGGGVYLGGRRGGFGVWY